MTFHKQPIMVLLVVFFCLAPVVAIAVETNMQAPDFTLRSVRGEQVSLSDFKGQLVLLKLATTWCPTCKELDAEIEKVGEFLQEKKVVVLEVFVQDSQSTVEEYLSNTRLPMIFHALLDDGQAYEAYSVYLIPRLLIIDAEQIVRFDSGGRIVLADGIAAMVEEFSRPSATGGSS